MTYQKVIQNMVCKNSTTEEKTV